MFARRLLVGNDVVAEVGDELLAQVEVGILVLARVIHHELDHTRSLRHGLDDGGFEGVPGLLQINADAAELHRVGGHERRRIRILGLEAEHLEETFAGGLGDVDVEIDECAIGQVAQVEGDGLQPADAEGGENLPEAGEAAALCLGLAGLRLLGGLGRGFHDGLEMNPAVAERVAEL